jgi:hypothetical protein
VLVSEASSVRGGRSTRASQQLRLRTLTPPAADATDQTAEPKPSVVHMRGRRLFRNRPSGRYPSLGLRGRSTPLLVRTKSPQIGDIDSRLRVQLVTTNGGVA